jgi:hypothetical protein
MLNMTRMTLTLRSQLGGGFALTSEGGGAVLNMSNDPIAARLLALLLSAIAQNAPDLTVNDEYGNAVVF